MTLFLPCPVPGLLFATELQGSESYSSFHLGRMATEADIREWDIDVAPDGAGLPEGSGSVPEGKNVYAAHCAGCHGTTGVEGPSPRLVGGQGTLATPRPVKTIGSYWPYATTLFDYINRAMPYSAPHSLTSSQVYAVVAWLLHRNGVIDEGVVLNARSLPIIGMPNQKGFVSDPRFDVNTVPPYSTETSALGDITFPTSGSPEAQPHFHRGVLLLHNFEYDDAAEAFQRAQSVDPDFSMAYWGEAMTYNHPLWGEQDRSAARNVLRRFGPTADARQAKTPTPRERAYLDAVERLYGEGDKHARDRAYEEAMGELAVRYPKDLEAKAFYALSILGATQGGRDGIRYLHAAAIAELVYRQYPRHPGAVHYMIHAYDDPQHAFMGLQAARVYGTIASAAPHAQHMPSHIYMALGLWEDVVGANEKAWKASEERSRRKQLGLEGRSYHTLYWLMYAYLQEGRLGDAKGLLELVADDARQSGSRYIQEYYASMRATYTVESQDWDTRGIETDRSALRFTSAVSELFAIGLSAVMTGDLDTARQALTGIRSRIAEKAPDASNPEVQSGKVVAKELEAMIWLGSGQSGRALALLEEAAALQEPLPYEYGPPFPVKPVHELLGEVHLKAGRMKQAKLQFKAALTRAPKRALSLKGLAQASQ